MTPLLLVLAVATSQAAPPKAQVERARKAVGPFKKELKETLMAAMKESPVKAIDVCAKEAPRMAADASKGGVTVGRSAFKLRNPGNAPKPWVQAAMEDLAKATPGSDASKAVRLPGGRTGYAEAIWVQAPCLVCHGAALAPAVDEALEARYPDDVARGYTEGDFRGVFWAEVDAPAKAPQKR